MAYSERRGHLSSSYGSRASSMVLAIESECVPCL